MNLNYRQIMATFKALLELRLIGITQEGHYDRIAILIPLIVYEI